MHDLWSWSKQIKESICRAMRCLYPPSLTRLVTYGCVASVLTSCVIAEEPDPEKPPAPVVSNPESRFAVEVDNSSDTAVSIKFAVQYYNLDGNADSLDFNGVTGRYAAISKQRTLYFELINVHKKRGLPAANRIAYPLFLLKIESASRSRHYLAIGGSQKDYENYVRDQLTLPEDTEILGYGYLYTPGDTAREELGLPVNNSQGTAIYTDLDPKRKAYSESGFVLKLKIEGDNSSDIHWDFSGKPIAQSTAQSTVQLTNQAYPASGSSGSSVTRR